MTPIVIRKLPALAKPVHVLVVVVGANDSLADLPGAGAFADEVVHFWREPRQFPGRQALSTITVLASDPDGEVSIEDDMGNRRLVNRPTFQFCKEALLEWATRIAKTDGVGVLHWIGHGKERAIAGDVVTLYVDGLSSATSSAQERLDWTKALWKINEITVGRPVYCFIDACRSDDQSLDFSEGLGSCNAAFHEGALVFQSALPGKLAHWLKEPEKAVIDAGCKGQAVGTRAFLAALESFGARLYTGAALHPILAAEVVESSSALVERWLAHQSISDGATTGPRRSHYEEILFTSAPKSVVRVHDLAPKGSSSCGARTTSSPQPVRSETSNVPFEFRLSREPHFFDFDVGTPRGPQSIVYPSERL